MSSSDDMAKLSASEKEKTKLRERQRRAITTKIFAGLRKYGGYNLPPRADINDVLRALAAEAGWVVESDGTTYRAQGSQPQGSHRHGSSHRGTSANSIPSMGPNPSNVQMFPSPPPSSLVVTQVPNGIMGHSSSREGNVGGGGGAMAAAAAASGAYPSPSAMSTSPLTFANTMGGGGGPFGVVGPTGLTDGGMAMLMGGPAGGGSGGAGGGMVHMQFQHHGGMMGSHGHGNSAGQGGKSEGSRGGGGGAQSGMMIGGTGMEGVNGTSNGVYVTSHIMAGQNQQQQQQQQHPQQQHQLMNGHHQAALQHHAHLIQQQQQNLGQNSQQGMTQGQGQGQVQGQVQGQGQGQGQQGVGIGGMGAGNSNGSSGSMHGSFLLPNMGGLTQQTLTHSMAQQPMSGQTQGGSLPMAMPPLTMPVMASSAQGMQQQLVGPHQMSLSLGQSTEGNTSLGSRSSSQRPGSAKKARGKGSSSLSESGS